MAPSPTGRLVLRVGKELLPFAHPPDFCHTSGLPSPTYTQLILKHRGEATKFIGQVNVDGEVFNGGYVRSDDPVATWLTTPASVPTASLKEARQQVAWMVYTGHFGQR